MFMYSYCYVCSALCILFHCIVLCIVCMQMYNVLLPPGVNPVAVNKIYRIISYHTITYIISHHTVPYHISYHAISSYHIIYHTMPYHHISYRIYRIISYIIPCHIITFHISHYIIYIISYNIISCNAPWKAGGFSVDQCLLILLFTSLLKLKFTSFNRPFVLGQEDL